ncbi:MAG: hypothetical protein B6D64_12885 [Bacteroidetes bacterium 4484_276]|nr:MAG: hypothetical protein B6D64_12885 [Bacteroidetes bacterium 4484_276]OYT12636.1 MAG: hypothetical protein B6I19_09320 [Bacteroidetes bacterium 4572_114]
MLFIFRAAEPGLPDYVIPVRTGTGGQAGFPFVVVSCRLFWLISIAPVFVGFNIEGAAGICLSHKPNYLYSSNFR